MSEKDDPKFAELTKVGDKFTFLRGGVTYELIDTNILPRMIAPGDAEYHIIYVIARREGERQRIGMLYSNAANLTELSNGLFNGPVKLYPDNRFISIYAAGMSGTVEEMIKELMDRGLKIITSVAARLRPVSEVEKGI